jgi:hypothetical protein
MLGEKDPCAEIPARGTDAIGRADTGEQHQAQGTEVEPVSRPAVPYTFGQQGAGKEQSDIVAAPGVRVRQRQKDKKQRQVGLIPTLGLLGASCLAREDASVGRLS